MAIPYTFAQATSAEGAWLDSNFAYVLPMTTAGDLVIGGTNGAPTRLAASTNGYVLTLVNGSPAWSASAAGMTNPMTSANDIIIGAAAGAPARLAVGADGKFLGVSGGNLAYLVPPGFSNPMTTTGDVIVGGASGAATRLALGANGTFLGVSGGILGYYTPTASVGWSSVAPASVTIGASPWVYHNTNSYAVQLYIYGGTASSQTISISKTGSGYVQIGNANGFIVVGPGWYVQTVYTSAPTGAAVVPLF